MRWASTTKAGMRQRRAQLSQASVKQRLALRCPGAPGHRLLLGRRGPADRRQRDDTAQPAHRVAGRRGVDNLLTEALAAYDRIIGLDLSEVAVDGSLHKAPCGGEGTGTNPTDRWDIPIGWVAAGANRNDIILLEPTLQAVADRGLLTEIVRTKKRTTGKTKTKTKIKKPLSLGMRWPVERTNSWFSNFGQLRRNTDRFQAQRLGQIALAVALILTAKLVKWPSNGTTDLTYLLSLYGAFGIGRRGKVETGRLVAVPAHATHGHPRAVLTPPRRGASLSREKTLRDVELHAYWRTGCACGRSACRCTADFAMTVPVGWRPLRRYAESSNRSMPKEVP